MQTDEFIQRLQEIQDEIGGVSHKAPVANALWHTLEALLEFHGTPVAAGSDRREPPQ